MAFPVAVQSAVFYFMACTPCMSARNRHRAKKKFDKERKERAALEADEPPLYRHPSPFNVNPYWEEEIMMGPSLPKKGRKQNNQSQRKLASAGQDSSLATRSSLVISSQGALAAVPTGGSSGSGGSDSGGAANSKDGAEATSTAPALTSMQPDRASNENELHPESAAQNPPRSPSLVPDDGHSMTMLETTATATGTSTTESIEGWNYKRYQREDEELWGSEPSRTHKLMDAIVKASSSAGRLLESTLGKERSSVTDQDRANFYAPTFIHPPVNDYHPPVVSSKPAHRDALRWMLQPPPPAKVMEGKIPVSRSTSVASSVNGGVGSARRAAAAAGSDVSLTRRMALEARLRRVDSANSGVTVTGRARGSTDEVVGSVGRAASRKSASGGGELRPKSQQRQMHRGAGRSRSGSLASSVEDPGWSSDEDGLLKTTWRFPGTAPPPIPAMPAAAALQGQQLPATRSKLETIISSDGGSKSDLRFVASRQQKENTPPSIATVEADKHSVEDDGAKASHERPAGSSLDSGLALTA